MSSERDFLTRAGRLTAAVAAAREHGVVTLDELRGKHGSLGDTCTGAQTAHPGVDDQRLLQLAEVRGRLAEISACGATGILTAAVDLVLQAQHAGEPVAWMKLPGSGFFPPDVAANGVDLSALVVVRVADATAAARAAERVLRSGAFGLVVMDLGKTERVLPTAQQGRLVTLAQLHDAAVVCLTHKPAKAPSLGSLVSLRAEAIRRRVPDQPGMFFVTIRALKDKRTGPGWTREAKRKAPPGVT